MSIKVISLDLDGVLFDGPSIAYPLAEAIGIGDKFLKISMQMSKEGLPLSERIAKGGIIWKGVPTGGEFETIIHDIELMPGAEEVVKQLKEWEYEVGCISSGVSQFFMKPFQRRLDLDFAYSNILGSNNGLHNGEVEFAMAGPQKAVRITEYLDQRGYNTENLASVGDGENDIAIFGVSALSIAFNPENEDVSRAATHTIHSKDLRDVLPFFKP